MTACFPSIQRRMARERLGSGRRASMAATWSLSHPAELAEALVAID
jgi:hypothetical protein